MMKILEHTVTVNELEIQMLKLSIELASGYEDGLYRLSNVCETAVVYIEEEGIERDNSRLRERALH